MTATSAPGRYNWLALVLLVLANLVPVAGVLWLGWQLQDLVVLYWLESAVVGIFTVAKLLAATPGEYSRWLHVAMLVFTVPFFAAHYGGFWVGHGLFVGLMFGEGGFLGSANPAQASGPFSAFLAPLLTNLSRLEVFMWPLVGMVVSHGAAFVTNFLQVSEERSAPLSVIMGRPYSRVFVLHISIILGGFVAMAVGPSIHVVLIFVAVKTIVDAQAHLHERRNAMRRAAAQRADSPAPATTVP